MVTMVTMDEMVLAECRADCRMLAERLLAWARFDAEDVGVEDGELGKFVPVVQGMLDVALDPEDVSAYANPATTVEELRELRDGLSFVEDVIDSPIVRILFTLEPDGDDIVWMAGHLSESYQEFWRLRPIVQDVVRRLLWEFGGDFWGEFFAPPDVIPSLDDDYEEMFVGALADMFDLRVRWVD